MIVQRQISRELPNTAETAEIAGANQLLKSLEAKAENQGEKFQDLRGPAVVEPVISAEKIEELFSSAIRIQSRIDRALELAQAKEEAQKFKVLRSSLDETGGEVALERVIRHAEEIGVSRQAIAEAYRALSLPEKRENKIAELERQLELPPGAGIDWINEERKIKGWVDGIRPILGKLIENIASNPEKCPDGKMTLASNLNLGALGNCCKAEFNFNSLKMLGLYSVPVFGEFLLGLACLNKFDFNVRAPNFKELRSPSLSKLVNEVAEYGGAVNFEYDHMDRFGNNNKDITVNLYLTLL